MKYTVKVIIDYNRQLTILKTDDINEALTLAENTIKKANCNGDVKVYENKVEIKAYRKTRVQVRKYTNNYYKLH